jgi:CheY-like chemotaxis protein
MLVEDNPADVALLREALEAGGWPHRLNVVHDGEAALDYLLRLSGHANAPRPDLILLDQNLPKRNGREVLAAIRPNRALAAIPVVIVTGSPWERDSLETLGVPADRYIVKPTTFAGFVAVARRIEEIWRTATASAGDPEGDDPFEAPAAEPLSSTGES